MHTRTIASQRAINDRWRSAGWESLILPGLTAIRGDREGGRKLFPRTLSELCSGSSEGTKGFLAPLPVSLLVQFFSSKREKVQKTVDDEINSFDNTKIAGRISSSLYDLNNCQFTASSFLSPFLFWKRKGNGGKKNRQGGRRVRPRTD